MTDRSLVLKKLASIETYVEQLRQRLRPEAIENDLEHRSFVERMLQKAIQAVQDIASHIVSDDNLGQPESNRDLFRLLAQEGWFDASQAEDLAKMISFRNILVHGYDDVNLDVVRSIAEHRLDDLLQFVQVVRGRLS